MIKDPNCKWIQRIFSKFVIYIKRLSYSHRTHWMWFKILQWWNHVKPLCNPLYYINTLIRTYVGVHRLLTDTTFTDKHDYNLLVVVCMRHHKIQKIHQPLLKMKRSVVIFSFPMISFTLFFYFSITQSRLDRWRENNFFILFLTLTII